MARKLLGQILLEMGALTQEQLQRATERLRSLPGRRLGEYLVSEGLVSEELVAQALAQQFGLPYMSLASVRVDPAVARMVSEEYARRQRVLPLYEQDGKLVVAAVDPLDVYALDDLGFVSGWPIAPVVVTSETLEALIRQAFGPEEGAPGRAAPPGPHLPPLREPAPPRRPAAAGTAPEGRAGEGEAGRAAAESPVVQVADEILRGAVEQGASDVHIEPLADALRVRYRVDGVLREVRRLDKAIHAELVSRIKILAGLDISERRLPQDGRLEARVAGHDVDVRVSTLPTIHGEKVALRLLDKSRGIPSLDELGMDPEELRRFRDVLRRPYGMILACGPTGSGKTTTMIAALQELNQPGVNVVTIEDPVEYEVPGVNHVAVNPRAGLTFAVGLRHMLRQDPDIILVGEIRDVETAEIATRAALTGHLVLSTMHANDAAGALTRLVDMGVEPFLVASSVAAVVAQRLVRVLCPHCKRAQTLREDDPQRFALGLPAGPLYVYAAAGCRHCGHAGYRGRTGIFELMVVNGSVRELVMRRASTGEIREAARRAGMRTLLEDGVAKVLEGITSLDEVRRMAFAE